MFECLSSQKWRCLVRCQRLSATYSPWTYPAWTPLDARHKNMRRGWQRENWFFTRKVRRLYPNRLAEYTNIPMLSSVVLLSATMRIGLTPLHSVSQTHGIDGQWEGNRGKEEREEKNGWCATLPNAHYSITWASRFFEIEGCVRCDFCWPIMQSWMGNVAKNGCQATRKHLCLPARTCSL